MRVSSLGSQVGFRAKLNDNTRKLIKEADKRYGTTLEKRIDEAINSSVLKDFGGDDTTISLGNYRFFDGWESDYFFAPVVNTKIQGKDVSVALPADGRPEYCDEEAKIAKYIAHDDSLQMGVLQSINRISISRLKEILIQKYIRQCARQMEEKATAETYDSFVSGKMNFPQDLLK